MRRSKTRKFSILALLFILISVPLAIYSIVVLPSFNTKEKAVDLTVDTQTCQIRFPYVNPESIEINKTVQATVSANTPNEAIVSVSIMDRTGVAIFSKEYTDGKDTISETFTLSPTKEGDFGILGTLITDKATRPCVIESKKTVMVVSSNQAPEFKTLPTSAKPSNAIKVNDTYQYQLEATDAEKDNINFSFSFTPNATWLKSTVIENGTNGQLTIKFTGAPDKPASYLANIFIHDGYNAHLRAQTWVISVDQDKNDIPKVSIIQPVSDIKITRGEKVTVSWEAADLNQIVRYELYIATNPGNDNTWMPINKNISPKVGNYIVDTKDIKDGVYQFVVRAVDNFEPAGVGIGFSAKVTVGSGDVKPGPDDGVVIQEAQVINLSPSNESQIKNKNAVVSATLIPSKDATILEKSIKIMIDDEDVTSKARITENGEDNSYSIVYSPEKPFSEGIHKAKINFEDSKGNKVEKEWTFTVIPDDSENSDVFKIFGLEIPKRIATIVAAGLAILLLALIVPWLLYLAWRGTKDEDDSEEIYRNTTILTPPPTPLEIETTDINEMEVEKEVKENKPKFTFTKFNLKKEQPKKVVTYEPDVKNENIVEINQPVEKVNEIESLPIEQEQNVVENIVNEPKVEIVQPVIQEEQTVVTTTEPIVETPQPVIPEIKTNDVIAQEQQPIPTIEDEISQDANRELEELAKKLQAKEEMIDQFIIDDQPNAPSSSPDQNNNQADQTPKA